ncbi:MAG: hypothetical protein ACRDZP_07730 [Acidimicrobiales bacterium]
MPVVFEPLPFDVDPVVVELGVVPLVEGAVGVDTLGVDAVGVEPLVGVVGADPPGSAMRKFATLFFELGCGMGAPFGRNAIVISWPLAKRSWEGSPRTRVPFFELGCAHTST